MLGVCPQHQSHDQILEAFVSQRSINQTTCQQPLDKVNEGMALQKA